MNKRINLKFWNWFKKEATQKTEVLQCPCKEVINESKDIQTELESLALAKIRCIIKNATDTDVTGTYNTIRILIAGTDGHKEQVFYSKYHISVYTCAKSFDFVPNKHPDIKEAFDKKYNELKEASDLKANNKAKRELQEYLEKNCK